MVTGRVERGVIKVGDEVEIVGLKSSTKSVVTGVEMFQKPLDQANPGDNVGLLLRGIEKGRRRTRPSGRQARFDHSSYQV